eukprot:gene13324-17855_t
MSSKNINSTIIYSGYVMKKPRIGSVFRVSIGSMKKRFLVLYNNAELEYHQSEEYFLYKPEKRKGKIMLNKSTRVVSINMFSFQIEINSVDKLEIACEITHEVSDWIDALTRTIQTLRRRRTSFTSLSGIQEENPLHYRISIAMPMINNATDPDCPINILCLHVWENNFVEVEKLLTHDPSLINEVGSVFRFDPNSGKIVPFKTAYPAALAAERNHASILSLLIKIGGASEQIKLGRMSMMDGNNWTFTPRKSESYGFHPVQMDAVIRETMDKIKLDTIQMSGKELSDLEMKYFGIMVDRVGNTEKSFMITKTIVLEITIGDLIQLIYNPDVDKHPYIIKINNYNNDKNDNNNSINNSKFQSNIDTINEDEDENDSISNRSKSNENDKDYIQTQENRNSCNNINNNKNNNNNNNNNNNYQPRLSRLSSDSSDHSLQSFKNLFVYDNLENRVNNKSSHPSFLPPQVSTVRYLEFSFKWNIEKVESDDLTNIFGENSLLKCEFDLLNIPINECTYENLMYFNCVLVEPDDEPFLFQIPLDVRHLPLTYMSVGEEYIEGFIMADKDGKSGCAYLEWHNNPHFHLPISPDCKGYLILGIMLPEKSMIQLGAFQIPFGKAIYMKPYTLHNDCFLVGDYYVVYGNTDDFATGVTVNGNNDP